MKRPSCAVWWAGGGGGVAHWATPLPADPHPNPHAAFSHPASVLDPGVHIIVPPVFTERLGQLLRCFGDQQPFPLKVSDLRMT